jgi:hypothetical protein
MPTRPSSLKQFNQPISENMSNLVLDGAKDPMKQTKACKTRFKQPQNGVRLSLKPTSKSKKNKTREKHKKGEHLLIM